MNVSDKIYTSFEEDLVCYPVIYFDHINWDFSVYRTAIELINDSIEGHWGYDQLVSDIELPEELIIDSKGQVFNVKHDIFHEEAKTYFSYPSEFLRTETVDQIRKRILESINEFPERNCNNLQNKLKKLDQLKSSKELVQFVFDNFVL